MVYFLADLETDVQCSLCNDTFIEPKILACFHTFCLVCIKRHAELIEEVNVFKCPTCKSETSLQELSSVEDLQPSLLYLRILKALALVEEEHACSVSESHSPASWYCFDCDRSMCGDCEKNHSEFIKDHKVDCLVDLKKDIELIITRENHCETHSNHRLELFCEDCDTMICVMCWKHTHKDHKIMSLVELASIKKAVLSKQLQVLEHLRLDDRGRQQQEKIAEKVKQQGEKATKEVKDKTKKMIEMLQENERELLRRIDEKLDAATRNLNILHHIPAVKEYINTMMKRGLASEMIDIQETQCSEKFIFNPILLSSIIAFVPNEELLQQVNSGLGELHMHSETDHKMSSIHVESDQESWRKKKLILTTKTSKGLYSFNAGDVVDIKISPKDDVKIGEKYTRTGKVEVEFLAKVAVQLTAEVKVNGNYVSNSPLVMNVNKPHQMSVIRQFKTKGLHIGPDILLRDIAVNRENSRIAVADCTSSCVYIFNKDGDLLLTYTYLDSPYGLAFLNDKDLVIVYFYYHTICIVNTMTGTLLKTFGKQGTGNGEFCFPSGVHVDDDSNIIVCDSGNHRVQVFSREGNYRYQFGLTEQQSFNPVSIVTHNRLFYVSDYNVIHVFEKRGKKPTRISTIGRYGHGYGQLSGPLGLAFDNDHHLLVCDRDNNRIQKFTSDGHCLGKTCEPINNPVYIVVLNDGQFLVATHRSGVWVVR